MSIPHAAYLRSKIIKKYDKICCHGNIKLTCPIDKGARPIFICKHRKYSPCDICRKFNFVWYLNQGYKR